MLAPPQLAYLKAHFDPFGESAAGEHSLDLWDNRGGDHPSLRSHSVDLLPNPGDQGEVLRKIRGQDPGDPVRLQIFKLLQVWNEK